MRLPSKRHCAELFIAALVTTVAVSADTADAKKRLGISSKSSQSSKPDGTDANSSGAPDAARHKDGEEASEESSGSVWGIRPKFKSGSQEDENESAGSASESAGSTDQNASSKRPGSIEASDPAAGNNVYSQHAQKALDDERQNSSGDKVHPLQLKYPGQDVTVCTAGCTPGGKVVYKIRKSAQKRVTQVAEMVPTAGTLGAAANSTALTCVAGCYTTPTKYRAVEKPVYLVPAPATSAAAVAAPFEAAAKPQEDEAGIDARPPSVGAKADSLSGKWAAPAEANDSAAQKPSAASGDWAPKVNVEASEQKTAAAADAAAPSAAKIDPVAVAPAAKPVADSTEPAATAGAVSPAKVNPVAAVPAIKPAPSAAANAKDAAAASKSSEPAEGKSAENSSVAKAEADLKPVVAAAPKPAAEAPVATAQNEAAKTESPKAEAKSADAATIEPAKGSSDKTEMSDSKSDGAASDAKATSNGPPDLSAVETLVAEVTVKPAAEANAAAKAETAKPAAKSAADASVAAAAAPAAKAPAEAAPVKSSDDVAPPAAAEAAKVSPAPLAKALDEAKPEIAAEQKVAALDAAKPSAAPVADAKPAAPELAAKTVEPAPAADAKPVIAPKVAARTDAKPAASTRVIDVSGEDAEMNAAIAKARANLEQFWASHAKPNPGETAFALKVAVSDKGDTEHFWVNKVERRGNTLVGTINNRPSRVKTVSMGQVYEFTEDRITDWMFMRNGKMVGNETMRPLLSRMPPEEAATYRSMLEKP